MKDSDKYDFMAMATLLAMNAVATNMQTDDQFFNPNMVAKPAVEIAEATLNEFEKKVKEMGLDED